jgi:DNA-binding SARP family transcriptional activator/Tol biopolymer transport system component/predicted Ser/Thr protein kinase
MEFLVLGPLEVRDERGPSQLGGPKQRAVLAHLILRAGRLVPVETLIDAVWGEEPPRTARNTLQTYVFRLRRAIGEDRIEGSGAGYALRAQPAEIDATRFETLVRQARGLAPTDPEGAASRFREALAIWRGPALADLADEHSLRGDIARLEELRLAATEQRITTELALGRHTMIVGELEQLTAEYPMRERLWASLMLALYRTGRQADALDAYRHARAILGEELGIDPSPELKRLHEQILGQDPDLKADMRPPTAAAPPPDSVPGDFEAGAEFAGYRIESVLGRGGMSVVYLAEHLGLQRKVALKVLAPQLASDDRFRERFVRESRIAASMEHPNIVPIYEAGDARHHLFIAMRYVRGTDLRRLLEREGQLDPRRAVRIVGDVAEALDAAHAAGLVHRDVKPGNILIVEAAGSAGRDLVFLSDFGLTKRLESGGKLTKTGQFVGTVDYVAPEQVEGRQIDARTDVYSLACVLFECLTGRVPYGRDTDVAALYAHLSEKPPTLTSLRPDLPTALNGVFSQALSKLPAKRQSTTGGFAQGASDALGLSETEGAGRAGTRPGGARRIAAVVGVAAVAAALLAGGIVYSVTRDEPSVGTSGQVSPPPPGGESFFAIVDRPLEEGDEQRLASYVPASFRSTCQPSTPVPQQLLAAIACVDGQQQVRYELFPTLSAMDTRFDQTASNLDAPAGDCAVEHEAIGGYSVAGTPAGRVLCYEISERSNIEWTSQNLLVSAHAIRQDLGDLSLYEWWASSAGPVDTTVASPQLSKDLATELPEPPQGLFLGYVTDDEAKTPRLRFNVSKVGPATGSWAGTWALRLRGEGYGLQHNGNAIEEGTFAFSKGPGLVFDAATGACADDTPAEYRFTSTADGSSWVNAPSPGRCLPGPWPVNTDPWMTGPSGQIGVVENDFISVFDLDGIAETPATLISDTRGPFDWSSDGSQITFTRGDESAHMDLWVADADGAGEAQLTDRPGHTFQPSWSPDGEIAFHSDATEGTGPPWKPSAISLVRPDGTGYHDLLTFGENINSPTWSPDGRQIAYLSGRSIFLVDASGTGQPRPIVSLSPGYPPFSWTPDGTQVVFFGNGPDGSGLYIVGTDGSGLRLIVGPGSQPRASETFLNSDELTPDVSPDGEWVAVAGGWGHGTALFLVHIEDGQTYQVSGGGYSLPRWRPESD